MNTSSSVPTPTNGAAATSAPRYVRDAAAHEQAVEFMHQFQPKEQVDYGWVLEYAKIVWAERTAEFTSLDNKADAIIKYLGGGLGLFAVGVLAKIDPNNAYLVLWTLPAIVCAISSVFCAAWSRKPTETPTPPPIEAAILYAEGEGDKPGESIRSRAAFLGQWNLVSEDHRIVNEMKAVWLERATWLYCVALGLLTLPLLAAVWFSYHLPGVWVP